MRRNGKRVLWGFLVLFILVSIGYTWSPAQVLDDWEYFDDFQTEKAQVDSYDHSQFFDSPPFISLSGYLMYGPRPVWMPPGQALGFYGGFDPDMYAVLCYRFPLEGGPYSITDCTIEVSVAECSLPFYIDASENGDEWRRVAQIDETGLHTVQVDHQTAIEGWQYLRFRGEGALLTSIGVSVGYAVPVKSGTWGAVKALYR